MKLKSTYETLPEGEWVLGIEGYGALKLFVRGSEVGCEEAEGETPELTLNCLEASRVLFGPLPAYTVTEVPPLVRSWLPLPLTWDFFGCGVIHSRANL